MAPSLFKSRNIICRAISKTWAKYKQAQAPYQSPWSSFVHHQKFGTAALVNGKWPGVDMFCSLGSFSGMLSEQQLGDKLSFSSNNVFQYSPVG